MSHQSVRVAAAPESEVEHTLRQETGHSAGLQTPPAPDVIVLVDSPSEPCNDKPVVGIKDGAAAISHDAAQTHSDVISSVLFRDGSARHVWHVHDMHIRCLAHPAAEWMTTHFVGNPAWPWTFFMLLFGVSVGVAVESELTFVVCCITATAWMLTAVCAVDPRAWRLMLTAPNALLLVNVAINLGCISQVCISNGLSAQHTLACVAVFALLPLAALLVPLKDSSVYSILLSAGAGCFPFMVILVKFYATGVFLGPFMGPDVAIEFWGHRFSPFVLIANSCTQLLGLFIRTLYISRERRAGYPLRLLGIRDHVALRYRDFPTDLLLSNRDHVRLMVIVQLSEAALLGALLVWKGLSR